MRNADAPTPADATSPVRAQFPFISRATHGQHQHAALVPTGKRAGRLRLHLMRLDGPLSRFEVCRLLLTVALLTLTLLLALAALLALLALLAVQPILAVHPVLALRARGREEDKRVRGILEWARRGLGW